MSVSQAKVVCKDYEVPSGLSCRWKYQFSAGEPFSTGGGCVGVGVCVCVCVCVCACVRACVQVPEVFFQSFYRKEKNEFIELLLSPSNILTVW